MGAIIKDHHLQPESQAENPAETQLVRLVDQFQSAYQVYAAEDGEMDRAYDSSNGHVTYDELRRAFIADFLRQKGVAGYTPDAFFGEYERIVGDRIKKQKAADVATIIGIDPSQMSIPIGPESLPDAVQQAQAIISPSTKIDHNAYETAKILQDIERGVGKGE